MNFALNHMTVPNLNYVDFLDLAAKLECVGVEVRNDIDRELFDGVDPVEAGKMAKDRGLRLVGLSQVYPFNTWDAEREVAVRDLIEVAKAAGAETISLIPRNDGTGLGNSERQANLRAAMMAILPMLRKANMVALVEPLGFVRSSLRSKSDLVDTINDIDGADHFKLVHDTFHHTLAGEDAIFIRATGIIHISAVVDPDLQITEMEDEHRVLVDEQDRLGNIEQIRALIAGGYDGPISYECFSPRTHAMPDPYSEIRASFEFITSRLRQEAA
ncbi:TIM barrel protein [Octadecabacter sp.]|nr:TIM barrel protein [Octadecabacter sp.]